MSGLSGREGVPIPYWTWSAGEGLEMMKSSASGLTENEAARRLTIYGPNTVSEGRKDSPLAQILRQFRSPIIIILIVATGISAITKDWVDALIILAIVFGSSYLNFVQERKASLAVARLRSHLAMTAKVRRGGAVRGLVLERIVPGDILELSAGSLVPADGLVLETRDFYVNQAILTGETFPVEKKPGGVSQGATLQERTNCVFMGANVRSGTATVMVVNTGKETALGQIADRISLRPPETEFERGVRRFGYLLSEVMMVLVLIVFTVNVYYHKPVIDSLLFSVALAVGITPQLLPAIIGVTLSKGSLVMARRGVIVRDLASIENFGSMDVLCTDKTGTLTAGTVRLESALDHEGKVSEEVLRLASINAHLQTGIANPLDDAIIAAHGVPSSVSKVDEIPYDFVRRRLSVVVRDGVSRRLISKGAFESVLDACSFVLISNGETDALDEAGRKTLHNRFEEWSKQGYRILGLAVKDPGAGPRYTKEDESFMTFYGFLLFLDPPKPGAKEAVGDLERLGVELKIITGDNRLVAQTVAKHIGIPHKRILTGRDLDELRDEALWQAANRTNIFAEVDPNQKERIILALKKQGRVVGYMGDGINDAPAMHAADVGISVDGAVDVAREAADLVLLERDLSVLHEGVVLGRRTFANTLKYVFMTTSANFGNMFSMAGVSLLLPFLPLLPVQILLANFLTDFPAITIASDSVDEILVEKPRRWDVHFIKKFMLTFGLVSSLFDYVTFALLLFVLQVSMAQFRTGWFFASVLTELMVLFVIRTRLPFYVSRPGRALLISSLAVASFTFLLVRLPLPQALGFVPLPLSYLGALGVVALLYTAVNEGVKKVFYARVTA